MLLVNNSNGLVCKDGTLTVGINKLRVHARDLAILSMSGKGIDKYEILRLELEKSYVYDSKNIKLFNIITGCFSR